jgi:uncharacterized repeat protein (TIGR01451 family)
MFAARSSTYDLGARGPDPGARHSARKCGFLVALLATVALFTLPVSAAFGEGSVDLNTGPDESTRQGLSVGATGGGFGSTAIFVYAQAGETIQVASSAMGVGTGNALLYPPPGAVTTPVWDCVADDGGAGLVADGAAGRAQELAGPEPTAGDADPNTYEACEYVVPAGAGGIYRVVYTGVDPATNNGSGTVEEPVESAIVGANLAIWDVTVRDAGGAVQPGRAYSYRYVLRTGGQGSSGVEAFVQTRTGYEYQVNLYDQGGANWTLNSDDVGVIDTATGRPLYASFACGPDNGTNLGCLPQNNQAGFGPSGRYYPLFLNSVDPIVVSGPGGLADTFGFATTPISPASNPLSNTFTGSAGQAGATNRGAGGTFDLTSPTQMAGIGYTLEIDINRNGTFGDAPDVVDTGELEADGSTPFGWNGQDGAGAVPACGDYPYRTRATLAEVHFALNDVEFSGGTRIERLTLPTDPTLGNPLAASYNDRDPFKNGYIVTTAQPPTVNDGISGPGFHAWGTAADGLGAGNQDYIDTWSKLPEVQTSGTLRLLCSDPQVVKTVEPAAVVPGEDATFKLEVKNNGPDAATNVSVTDDLPDTVTFKSASQGCAEAATVVTCGVASLAPGATHTFEIVVAVPSSLDECIENSATVTNTTFDTNLANNTSADCFEIKGRSNLKITKAASTPTVPPGGGQVMYTIVVENDGPSDDPGVTVRDALDPRLTLVSAQPSQGTCTTTSNTVDCDLGTLKDEGSAQVLVTVNTTATAGCIPNTARVQGAHEDPDPSDNQASAQVCVEDRPDPKFDLAVDKRVNVTRPVVGQRVTYTVVVTNNGPDAAPAAKLTDTYNNRATVVSVSTTAGSCTKAMPITCELGRIESGASVTVTVVIKPRESGRARNAASATSCCGTDRVPGNNMDGVVINVRKVALKLSKVASRSSVAAGDTLSYRIRVRNPSKGEARNVKVCDRLPSGLRFVSSSPKAKRSGGQRCWTIRSLKAGKSRTYRVTVRTSQGANGRKVNRATLSGPDTKRVRAKDPIRVLGQATPVTG